MLLSNVGIATARERRFSRGAEKKTLVIHSNDSRASLVMAIGDGLWAMDYGRWSMGDGRWW